MLNDLLKIHKKTVLLGGNGFSVECLLKPFPDSEGYLMRGLSSFIGVTYDENGKGFCGDSFEFTIDVEDVKKYTDLTPTRLWSLAVDMPQFNAQKVPVVIEEVAIDRTLGMYLFKCTASTSEGKGKRVDRNRSGGI